MFCVPRSSSSRNKGIKNHTLELLFPKLDDEELLLPSGTSDVSWTAPTTSVGAPESSIDAITLLTHCDSEFECKPEILTRPKHRLQPSANQSECLQKSSSEFCESSHLHQSRYREHNLSSNRIVGNNVQKENSPQNCALAVEPHPSPSHHNRTHHHRHRRRRLPGGMEHVDHMRQERRISRRLQSAERVLTQPLQQRRASFTLYNVDSLQDRTSSSSHVADRRHLRYGSQLQQTSKRSNAAHRGKSASQHIGDCGGSRLALMSLENVRNRSSPSAAFSSRSSSSTSSVTSVLVSLASSALLQVNDGKGDSSLACAIGSSSRAPVTNYLGKRQHSHGQSSRRRRTSQHLPPSAPSHHRHQHHQHGRAPHPSCSSLVMRSSSARDDPQSDTTGNNTTAAQADYPARRRHSSRRSRMLAHRALRHRYTSQTRPRAVSADGDRRKPTGRSDKSRHGHQDKDTSGDGGTCMKRLASCSSMRVMPPTPHLPRGVPIDWPSSSGVHHRRSCSRAQHSSSKECSLCLPRRRHHHRTVLKVEEADNMTRKPCDEFHASSMSSAVKKLHRRRSVSIRQVSDWLFKETTGVPLEAQEHGVRGVAPVLSRTLPADGNVSWRELSGIDTKHFHESSIKQSLLLPPWVSLSSSGETLVVPRLLVIHEHRHYHEHHHFHHSQTSAGVPQLTRHFPETLPTSLEVSLAPAASSNPSVGVLNCFGSSTPLAS